MVVSTVLPTLIRLNHMINPITKVNLIHCSRYTVKPLYPVKLIKRNSRLMSSNVDKDLNDPKRHFDYNQLNIKRKNGDIVIIDVREHSEINETGKIPGSIHIPLNSLQNALEMSDEKYSEAYFSRKPKIDDEIIFTCRSGRKSQIVLEKALGNMTDEEFKNTYSADKPKKTDEIIFSCKAGGRSFKALKLGLELGYTKAGNYKGGWLDWAEKSKLN